MHQLTTNQVSHRLLQPVLFRSKWLVSIPMSIECMHSTNESIMSIVEGSRG